MRDVSKNDSGNPDDEIITRGMLKELLHSVPVIYTGAGQDTPLTTGGFWVGSPEDMKTILQNNAIKRDWIYFIDAQAPINSGNTDGN